MVWRRFVLTLIFSLGAMAQTPLDLNKKQYQALSHSAKTVDAYEQLASFASMQAERFRRKAAECQEELDGYTSGRVPYPVIPKYPKRDETLKSLIGHYKRSERKWRSAESHWNEKASHGKPGHLHIEEPVTSRPV